MAEVTGRLVRHGAVSTGFEAALERAGRDAKALRRMLNVACERVAQAKLIGWPALAASWETDMQRVAVRLRAGA